MKAGIVILKPEALRALLLLPEDCVIENARLSFDRQNIELFVTGEGMPHEVGMLGAIPLHTLFYSKVEEPNGRTSYIFEGFSK